MTKQWESGEGLAIFDVSKAGSSSEMVMMVKPAWEKSATSTVP
jgi:hypothetical protein